MSVTKKNPAAKAAKKPAKKASVAKKPAAKKPAAKKPAAKASAKKAEVSAVEAQEKVDAPEAADAQERKEIHRVPPKIIRKPSPNARLMEEEYVPIDTEKAVAFAMSIAEEMKRSAAAAEARREQEEKDGIRLSRRPTTRAQGKSTVMFPASDLKEFRRRLLEARQRAASDVDAVRSTGFSEADDHEADGGDGTAQTLRLQARVQMGNINRTIQKIDEALHRIDDGTYGVCTVCGQLIRKPRLLNQPFVLTCMECQSEMERAAK